MKARISEITPLTNTIVKLNLNPQKYLPYEAGQYLQMRTGEHLAYFSIANAPLGSKLYELHIRHEQQHKSSQALLSYIQEHGEVEINLPKGQCHVGNFFSKRPIIFIAGGTGFAPIKAIIEYLLYTDDSRQFECYWMAKIPSDLYWQQQLKAWQLQVPSFKYLALHAGISAQTVLQEIFDRHGLGLKNFQFMVSGAFDMVYSIRDQLLAWGIEKQYIFSDAFEFEEQG